MTKADLTKELRECPATQLVFMRAGWGPFVIDEAIIFQDHVRLYSATIMRWAREVVPPESKQPRQLRTCGDLINALAAASDDLPVYLSGTATKRIEFEFHRNDEDPDGPRVNLDGKGRDMIHNFPDVP